MIEDIDDTFVVKYNCSKRIIIIEFAKKKKKFLITSKQNLKRRIQNIGQIPKCSSHSKIVDYVT